MRIIEWNHSRSCLSFINWIPRIPSRSISCFTITMMFPIEWTHSRSCFSCINASPRIPSRSTSCFTITMMFRIEWTRSRSCLSHINQISRDRERVHVLFYHFKYAFNRVNPLAILCLTYKRLHGIRARRACSLIIKRCFKVTWNHSGSSFKFITPSIERIPRNPSRTACLHIITSEWQIAWTRSGSGLKINNKLSINLRI